ncbi:MAG: acyltransferase, partial [Cytophagales bacterium]|nr:acyltransferase [Cytophaga sp.]
IGLYIAFVKLAPDIPLSEQWSHYINPFNNFFFYVMGVFIYYNLKDVTIPNLLLTGMIVISVLLFMLLPFEGNQIHLVTGIPRIIFIVISFLIVVVFYKINIQLPALVERPLTSLGIATYGIYLLHPVVYTYLQFIFVKLHIHASSYMLFGIVVLCTIALSLVSYHYVELKFIALGKKLFSK